MALEFRISVVVLLSCFLAGSCSARVLHQAPVVYSTVPVMEAGPAPAATADAAANATKPAVAFNLGLGLREQLAAAMATAGSDESTQAAATRFGQGLRDGLTAAMAATATNESAPADAAQFGFGLRERLAAAAMPAAVDDAVAAAPATGADSAATAEAANLFGQGLLNWGLRDRLTNTLQLPAIAAMQGKDDDAKDDQSIVVEVPANGDVTEAVKEAVANKDGATVDKVETVIEPKKSEDIESKEEDKTEKPGPIIEFPVLAVLPDVTKRAKNTLESAASITLEKFKAGELKLPAQEDVKSTVRSTVKKAAEDPIGLVTGKIDPELMTAVEKSIQQSAKIANALMAVREAQKKADAARPKNEDGITFAAWYKEVLDKAATITKYVEPTVIKIEEDYCDDCDDDGDDDYSNDIIINRPANGNRPDRPGPGPDGRPTRPGNEPRPNPGNEPRPTPGNQPRPRPGNQPRPRPGSEPRPRPPRNQRP